MSIYEDANKHGATGVKQSSYGYIPDNMEQTRLYFNDGLYTNVLNCTVGDDGILKIGIKKSVSNSNDWNIFDNFTLSYLGLQEEDEPEEPNGINTISHTLKPAQGIYT
ncbi:MAG: hypothetical protein KBT29_03405, partial [Prevotellaceae bacterium]|nr:hypothetical protein [Candidatus Minthosoma caballi]